MKAAMQFGYYSDEGSSDEREIMESFQKYLSRAGINVVTADPENPDIEDCDIVHVFGLSDQTYALCRLAMNLGKPTLITPFYWNDRYPIHYKLESLEGLDDAGQPKLAEKKLDASYFQKKMLSDRNRQQTFMLKSCILTFACGRCEKMQLVRDYDLKENRVIQMPVGIDLTLGVGKPEVFTEKFGVEHFVLCVGELSARKNQHLLIEITRDLDLPLVLIGRPGPEEKYVQHCRDIAHDKVHFIEEVEPKELKAAYQAARAYAMPSTFELPGMAYMPAALAGLPIVATCRGSAWDYLGNHVNYCDPEDIASVFDALSRCVEEKPSGKLKDMLLQRYSWGKTTVMLARIYSKLVEMKS